MKAIRGQLVVVEAIHSCVIEGKGRREWTTFHPMVARKVNRAGLVTEAMDAWESTVKIRTGVDRVHLVAPEMMNGYGARGVMARMNDGYDTIDEIRAVIRAILCDVAVPAAVEA